MLGFLTLPKTRFISDLPALVVTAVIVGISVTKSKARFKDAYQAGNVNVHPRVLGFG